MMSRLVLDVSSEQHQIIKALAATEGKSIKDFMLEKVLPDTDEGEAVAWAELKKILSERLQGVAKNGVSSKSISDITEDALKGLGKA
jgi:hypothetical protein